MYINPFFFEKLRLVSLKKSLCICSYTCCYVVFHGSHDWSVQWQQNLLDSMTVKLIGFNDIKTHLNQWCPKLTWLNDSKIHLIQWQQNSLDSMTAKLTWFKAVKNLLDSMRAKLTWLNDSKIHLIQWQQNLLDSMTANLTWFNNSKTYLI